MQSFTAPVSEGILRGSLERVMGCWPRHYGRSGTDPAPFLIGTREADRPEPFRD